MAVSHFIQTIWSKKIQDSLELKTKLVQSCTTKYEGDVKYASSVKILAVGDPTVSAYNSANDITIEEMSDASQLLTIDQANYFAFYVDDINKAQSVPGLAEKYQAKAVHKLAVARDTYIANLIKAGTNVTTASNLTKSAVIEALDNAIVALQERNFDEDGVIEVTPAVHMLIKDALEDKSTNNVEYIKNGVVGVYSGFPVVMSNNMAKDTTGATKYQYCDIRGLDAIAFAGQINEVESMRAEKRFKDIVRGLDTFGSKTIDQAKMQVVKVPLVASA